MRPPNALRLVFLITLSAILLGGLFANAEYQPTDAAGVVNACLHGALVGGVTAGILAWLEIFGLRNDPGAFIRQLPFLVYLGLRSLLYVAIILIVAALVNRLVPTPSGEIAVITRADIGFSLAASFGYNLLFGVNALLGPGVLFAFAAGRYRRPRLEERALLFVDMRASTAITERLGDARFLDFLNRFIVDVSLAIGAAGGEVHKYVGDEIIATWRLRPGLNAPRCVSACFGALERLALEASSYEREFGVAADFRAGLHCGAVAVGELGYLKKEIALIGDAMNTAARIQEACRETGCRVLASAALLERLSALPAGVAPRALGLLPMRGKQQALEVFALEAEDPRDAAVEPARVPRAAAPPPVRAWTDLTLGFRE